MLNHVMVLKDISTYLEPCHDNNRKPNDRGTINEAQVSMQTKEMIVSKLAPSGLNFSSYLGQGWGQSQAHWTKVFCTQILI
jgi:hypothetical protein